MNETYPRQASELFYRTLGWNDCVAAYQKISRGKRSAALVLALLDRLEKIVATLNERKSIPSWYCYGLEDYIIESERFGSQTLVTYQHYLPFTPATDLKYDTMTCDWCDKEIRAYYYIDCGIAENSIVCSLECGRQILQKRIGDDPWLVRLHSGKMSLPVIDLTLPLETCILTIVPLPTIHVPGCIMPPVVKMGGYYDHILRHGTSEGLAHVTEGK